jgi:hypothetical protein
VDEVVDEDADVGCLAPEVERFPAGGREGGVEAGDDSLTSRLLVARGAVDLPGEIESGDGAHLRQTSSCVGGK